MLHVQWMLRWIPSICLYCHNNISDKDSAIGTALPWLYLTATSWHWIWIAFLLVVEVLVLGSQVKLILITCGQCELWFNSPIHSDEISQAWTKMVRISLFQYPFQEYHDSGPNSILKAKATEMLFQRKAAVTAWTNYWSFWVKVPQYKNLMDFLFWHCQMLIVVDITRWNSRSWTSGHGIAWSILQNRELVCWGSLLIEGHWLTAFLPQMVAFE